jgi:hypothetical protein
MCSSNTQRLPNGMGLQPRAVKMNTETKTLVKNKNSRPLKIISQPLELCTLEPGWKQVLLSIRYITVLYFDNRSFDTPIVGIKTV